MASRVMSRTHQGGCAASYCGGMTTAPAWVDLNADLGELPGAPGRALDAALLELISSANVACGGHAGDAESMAHAAELAVARAVSIGAQVSYPDRENFGRVAMDLPPEALRDAIATQLDALTQACTQAGTRVHYIRPHGALYHAANADAGIANAVIGATLDVLATAESRATVWALSSPGSELVAAARAAGMPVATEVFIDRGYHRQGTLLPRGHPGDLIVEPDALRERVSGFLTTNTVRAQDGTPLEPAAFGAGHGPIPRSMCLHSDTPGALTTAKLVREVAASHGVSVRSFAQDLPDAPDAEER